VVNPVSSRTNDVALTTDDQFFSAKQDLNLARRKTAYFRPYDKPRSCFENIDRRTPWCNTVATFEHWGQSEVDNHVELKA